MNWSNVAKTLRYLAKIEENISIQIQSTASEKTDLFVLNRMNRSKLYIGLADAIDSGIE